jgi:hypothetical protein
MGKSLTSPDLTRSFKKYVALMNDILTLMIINNPDTLRLNATLFMLTQGYFSILHGIPAGKYINRILYIFFLLFPYCLIWEILCSYVPLFTSCPVGKLLCFHWYFSEETMIRLTMAINMFIFDMLFSV